MGNIFLIELLLGDSIIETLESSTQLLNQMLADGKIQTYGISDDLTKLWVTFVADVELEAWEVASKLPVEAITEPLITKMLTFNQSIELQFPTVSLN